MSDAAEAVTETTEAIASVATDAIETAQEQVNQAQETAEAIARAAMETELGRRIEAHDGAIIECRNSIQEQANRLETMLAERLTAFGEAMATAHAEAVAQLREALAANSTRTEALEQAVSALTPPTQQQATETPIVDPETGQSEPAQAVAPVLKKRHRFL